MDKLHFAEFSDDMVPRVKQCGFYLCCIAVLELVSAELQVLAQAPRISQSHLGGFHASRTPCWFWFLNAIFRINKIGTWKLGTKKDLVLPCKLPTSGHVQWSGGQYKKKLATCWTGSGNGQGWRQKSAAAGWKPTGSPCELPFCHCFCLMAPLWHGEHPSALVPPTILVWRNYQKATRFSDSRMEPEPQPHLLSTISGTLDNLILIFLQRTWKPSIRPLEEFSI